MEREDWGATPEWNEFGQPVGPSMAHWTAPPTPPRDILAGRLVRLEPLGEAHAAGLLAADARKPDRSSWTYLPWGPFDLAQAYAVWIAEMNRAANTLPYAIVECASDAPVGFASYMRINPADGSIEVGGIRFSSFLQRTPGATEAMALLMRQAFALGYRRYEWKCDALNAPSRRAAERLGFQFEGIFRQDRIVRGRSRDTAWYSIVQSEWPAIAAAYERWLSPDNFDADGNQLQRLSDLTRCD